jgi:hypothetical protein
MSNTNDIPLPDKAKVIEALTHSDDDLLLWGIASRACILSRQGFTVANYYGFDIWLKG